MAFSLMSCHVFFLVKNVEPKPKKLTKKELEEQKRIAERTVEDELEEQDE